MTPSAWRMELLGLLIVFAAFLFWTGVAGFTGYLIGSIRGHHEATAAALRVVDLMNDGRR